MLYEYQRATDSIPLGTVAMTTSECGQVDMTFSQAMQVLERMVDEGSRFANLERVLGCGAVFLLCHAGSDALGTNFLPKTGERFDDVIRALRNAGVDTMAGDYFDFRGRVVTWYHDHVLNGSPSGDTTTSERTPVPSSAYTEANQDALLVDAVENLSEQDPCLSWSCPAFPPDLLIFE
ncbi:hypothetical protein LTR22_027348 [Elasticomyces elasticus]|nr:hypothetical protein LTR22_027348 [Elasticomyces elasticus]